MGFKQEKFEGQTDDDVHKPHNKACIQTKTMNVEASIVASEKACERRRQESSHDA